MPKVSVIIPTYNRAHYIGETIDSVLSQTYQDFEIIVVDDGSTDDTKKVLEKYNGKVRYIRQDNAGSAAARNRGISEAKGEYIALLDDDDLWLPEKLEKQVPALDTNPNLAFVCSEVLTINKSGKAIGHWRKTDHKNIQETFSDLYNGNFINILTVVVRRRYFDEVGGFDRNLKTSEDYDLWLRLAKRYSFCYMEIPLAKYRVHCGRKSDKTESYDLRMRNSFKILNKREIVYDISLLRRHLRTAMVYYQYAKLYAKHESFFNACVNYCNAVLTYPLVGLYFWPKGTNKHKFPSLYRLSYPYFFIGWCLARELRHKLQKLLFPQTEGYG